jgi:mycothiol synthase
MTAVAADSTTQRIIARPFQNGEDFWRVRSLLVETYPITPTDFNWDIRRWDGWRFYDADPAWNPRWEKQVCLWETEDGRLVGAVHPEGDGDAHLQLHPDYRHIEEDMIAWAEDHLATPTDDGQQHQLHIFVYEYDSPRRRLLEQRGYEKTPDGGATFRLRFGNKPLPQPMIAEGYTLRTTRPGDEGDFQRIADIANAAFNRDFHNAGEYRTFTTMAPSFRHDLDLVAEAPDGTFAALVGMIYDETNRYGLFEPVCTHPDHRRKGLARTLMFEGLHRLKALGATDVYVGTGDAVPANRLYEAVGFTEAYKGYIWRKVF